LRRLYARYFRTQKNQRKENLIYIDQRDEFDNYCTIVCIIKGFLIPARADINRRDRFFTPLIYECCQGDEEINLYLLDCGAVVAVRNFFDLSALEFIKLENCQKKYDLLQRLGYSAGRPQLDTALLYAFNTAKDPARF
jgi:ankyrin repeat protein